MRRALGFGEILLGSLEKQAIKGKQQPAPLEPATSPEPLPTDPGAFWNGGQRPNDPGGAVNTPRVSAALPKRLGNFLFWRGSDHFLDMLEKNYAEAAPVGLDAYLGKRLQG